MKSLRGIFIQKTKTKTKQIGEILRVETGKSGKPN